MKTEMILAFKKKLSQIDDFNEIKIEFSTNSYFGGYSNFKFDNFNLSQILWFRQLIYKDTTVEITDEEWKDLKNLTEERKTVLQKTESCKDYVEIMNIINS